jgi:hypothetical protein
MSFRDLLPVVNKASLDAPTKTEPSPTLRPRRATRAISVIYRNAVIIIIKLLTGESVNKKASFNVPLGSIEHKTFFGLPVIFDKTIEFLETRGIFIFVLKLTLFSFKM